jgi:hypothetical protein
MHKIEEFNMTSHRAIYVPTQKPSRKAAVAAAITVLASLALASCGRPEEVVAPQESPDSLPLATSPNPNTGRAARTTIANDMWGTAAANFRRIRMAEAEGNLSATSALVAARTRVMLENMTAGATTGESFIHPVAFFATVKDFESAVSLSWAGNYRDGNGSSRWHPAFTTRNCYSGECYGLFQVDVKLETYGQHPWSFRRICATRNEGQGGLGLSEVRGGPDFCAAQYWWTVAAGGQKCAALSPSGANPCVTPGVRWTRSMVNRGRAAYVQAIQPGWSSDAWSRMYGFYEDILVDRERAAGTSGSRDQILRASVRRWKAELGGAASSLRPILAPWSEYTITNYNVKLHVDASGAEAYCQSLNRGTVVTIVSDGGGPRVEVRVPAGICKDYLGVTQTKGWISHSALL